MTTHPKRLLPAPADPPLPASTTAARPSIDSRQLLQGARMIEIAHEGTVYRLQATRQGKLILTK